MKTTKNTSHFDNEYFEEDIKTENDEEKKQKSNFMSHVCNICHKVYKSKSSLSTHIKSVHKGIEYKCDQCEYQAAESSIGNYDKPRIRSH